MSELDKIIQEALDEEDRRLHEKLGEQNIFAQALSVYDGKIRWIAIMATIMSFVMFGGAVFAGWKFVNADAGTIDAFHWGAMAWLLMTMVAFIKVWFWMRMESNRILREIKRLELQIVRLQPNNG